MVFSNKKAPAMLSAFFAAASGAAATTSDDNVAHAESKVLHRDLMFVPSKIAQEMAQAGQRSGPEIDNKGIMESLYGQFVPPMEKKLKNRRNTKKQGVTLGNADPLLDLGVLEDIEQGKMDVHLPRFDYGEWERGLDESFCEDAYFVICDDAVAPNPFENGYDCSGDRPKIEVSGEDFQDLVDTCLGNGNPNRNPVAACPYDGPIGCWDVSEVTDMDYAFAYKFGFRGNLNAWDVSRVTTMRNMFQRVVTFKNTLEDWDVSKVKNFRAMFYKSFSSTARGLGNWNVSSATNMASMFSYTQFLDADFSNWDVSNVKTMANMFYGGGQGLLDSNLNEWNVSKVTNMFNMFASNNRFNSPLDKWDVSNVTDMRRMFAFTYKFNQNIESWDIGKITSTKDMFLGADGFNQPLEGWSMSKVKDITAMFRSNDAFNQPLNAWDTGSVTSMQYTFGISSFNQPLDEWNVSRVEDLSLMFRNNEKFNGALDGWDTSNVRSLSTMFQSAYSFNQPLNSWDTSSVTSMSKTFAYCRNFNQPLDGWDVSNVGSFFAMFRDTSFDQPLDSWQVISATNLSVMFDQSNFNRCLSTWPQEVAYNQSYRMLTYKCPISGTGNGELPESFVTWCQGEEQGCIAPNCKVYTEEFALCGAPRPPKTTDDDPVPDDNGPSQTVLDDDRRRLQEDDDTPPLPEDDDPPPPTSAPTSPSAPVCGCDNNPLFKFKKQSCADIAALSVKKRQKKCRKKKVKKNCPGVCVCDNIDPLAGTTCAELSKQPTFQELCNLVPNVYAQCGGLCEGEERCPCTNSIEPFKVGGKTKTCDEIDALGKEDRENQCKKKKVNKNCPGVCNCRKAKKKNVEIIRVDDD